MYIHFVLETCYTCIMVKCKCKTKDTMLLSVMQPYQGELKNRTQKDIEDLKDSLLSDGLLMPFALWNHDGVYNILDGHGRYAALIKAALTDVSILTQEFPVIIIEATDDNEARKALLQITSSYGKVNKQGLINFAAPISGYKAPIVTSINKPVIKHKVLDDSFQIIKIRVAKDCADDVLKILGKTPSIEVL